MILVTGATGQFGGNAISSLIDKGVEPSSIVALVRDIKKADALKKLGVEVREADYNNLPSLEKAFTGIDKVLLVSSSDKEITNRTKHHIQAITAAKATGVKHIVYTSFVRKTGYQQSAIADFQRSHVESERFLIDSGIDYTILQNGIYLEMIPIFSGEKVVDTGTILLPAADGQASWVLRADLAEAAAEIISSHSAVHKGKIYSLTNNTSVSFHQIASELSNILGKTIAYNSPDLEVFKSGLKSEGVPDLYIAMFVMWSTALAEGALDYNDNVLEQLLGRKPVSYSEFLAKVYAS